MKKIFLLAALIGGISLTSEAAKMPLFKAKAVHNSIAKQNTKSSFAKRLPEFGCIEV